MNGDLTVAAWWIEDPTIASPAFSCCFHHLATGNMPLFSSLRHGDKLIEIYVFWGRYTFSVIACAIANSMQYFSLAAAYVVSMKLLPSAIICVSISVGLAVELWIRALGFMNLTDLKPLCWEYKITVWFSDCIFFFLLLPPLFVPFQWKMFMSVFLWTRIYLHRSAPPSIMEMILQNSGRIVNSYQQHTFPQVWWYLALTWL